jgi:Protein of unknown function (DUF3455)
MKFRSLLGGVQLSFVTLLAGCATTASAPEPLRVPATAKLLKQLHAKGVQIYECQPAKNNPSQFEWSFKQPEATLYTKTGGAFGKHYAGPSWEANDGSKVTGEMVQKVDSSKPDSIPWLLLRAKTIAGHGIFTRVTYIQRLNTAGGSAPVHTCSPSQAGQQLRVNYTADYLFYGDKS